MGPKQGLKVCEYNFAHAGDKDIVYITNKLSKVAHYKSISIQAKRATKKTFSHIRAYNKPNKDAKRNHFVYAAYRNKGLR